MFMYNMKKRYGVSDVFLTAANTVGMVFKSRQGEIVIWRGKGGRIHATASFDTTTERIEACAEVYINTAHTFIRKG
jgi:hypothetical protein